MRTESSLQTVRATGLVIVLSSIALVSSLLATIFAVTNTHTQAARRTVDRTCAIAYADGVMESLYDQWRQAMTGVSNPTDRSNGLSNSALASSLTAPTSVNLPVPPGVSLQSWSVTACTPLLAPTTDPSGRPVSENGNHSR